MTKFRKTCESCALQKRKCGGEKPSCSRCLRMNRECVYEPMKRRGRKRRQDISYTFQISKRTVADCDIVSIEKNKFISFLFKFVLKGSTTGANSIINFDIGRHLQAFRNHSSAQNLIQNDNGLEELSTMIVSSSESGLIRNIRSREVSWDDWKKFSLFDERVGGAFNSNVPLSPVCSEAVLLPIRRARDSNKYPCMRMRSDISTSKGPKERYFKVEVSREFTRVFGLTAEDIKEKLSGSLLGFMPFGIGLMSLLAPTDELRKYLEIHCMKAEYLEKPKQSPWLWETFDISVYNLFVNSGRKGETSSFLLTSAIRYLNTVDSCFEEIYIFPKPLEELPEIPEVEYPGDAQKEILFNQEMDKFLDELYTSVQESNFSFPSVSGN
eukprot:snap_masked-scaffold_5-processed-gene-1.48-mRNA-1 protein AED:1.00 eAED:1.00 QI:0/-1/0/0/-1/1/1/0/381